MFVKSCNIALQGLHGGREKFITQKGIESFKDNQEFLQEIAVKAFSQTERRAFFKESKVLKDIIRKTKKYCI